mgnify:CR=1 FL=1
MNSCHRGLPGHSHSHDLLDNIDPDDNFFNAHFSSVDQELQSSYFSVDNYNSQFQDSNDFTILTFNIRSFNANGDLFIGFLSGLRHRPDIIVLTETWANESNCDQIAIDGYTCFQTVRVGDGRGGGVCVFVDCKYACDKLYSASLSNNIIETCTVKLSVGDFKLVVIGVYRPHVGAVIDFNRELDSLLRSDKLKNVNVVLSGDFNINMLNAVDLVDRYINMLQSLLFVSAITKPTRFSPISNSTPSLLDHAWLKFPLRYISGIFITSITDHCPTFIKLTDIVPSKNSNFHTIQFRSHSPAQMERFKQKLLAVDWRSDENETIDERMLNFSSRLNELYVSCFPLNSKRFSEKRLNNPWLTPGILRSIKRKSYYFKMYRLGYIEHEFLRQYSNKLTSVIRNSKKMYFNKAFNDSRHSMRNTWKIIGQLMNRKSNRGSIKSVIVDYHEYTDDSQIARSFNEYFSHVAIDLDEQITNYHISPIEYLSSDIPKSFFMRPVVPSECISIISNLKLSSCYKNALPVKVLKIVKHILAEPICNLINLSIESATFPSILKFASITPVYKKDDRTLVSNYRPIAVLPLLSKIFEKFITVRLTDFFLKHKIISPSQFGFQSGVSTVDALTKLTDFIYDSLNSRNHTVGVFVDLQKAFDTVNHGILLQKLNHYGVRGLPLAYLASYLRDRKQRVKINSTFSDAVTVNIGIPQGSTVGPLLFLIYINDLPSVSNSLSCILFADDTTFLSSNSNYTHLINSLNTELEKIDVWFAVNRLSLSSSKSFAMSFSNRPHDVDNSTNIKIGTSKLKFELVSKFLGMLIDNRLSFSDHISHISRKISKFVGILYKVSKYSPYEVLLSMYYSFVYPYLLYGILVWGGASDVYSRKLLSIQKKVVRIITKSDYLAHTGPLFHRTEILKISDIYVYQVAIYMFKRKLSGDIVTASHNYSTRYSNLALPTFHRLSISQRSLSFSGPSVWNNIPYSIQSVESVSIFKRTFKKHLLSKYIP